MIVLAVIASGSVIQEHPVSVRCCSFGDLLKLGKVHFGLRDSLGWVGVVGLKVECALYFCVFVCLCSKSRLSKLVVPSSRISDEQDGRLREAVGELESGECKELSKLASLGILGSKFYVSS